MASSRKFSLASAAAFLVLGIGIGWLGFGLPAHQGKEEAEDEAASLEKSLEKAIGDLMTLEFLRFRGDVPQKALRSGREFAIAEITLVSPVPDPKTAPYRDCLAYCEANLIRSEDGTLGDVEPVAVVLGMPGFVGRELRIGADLEPGDWVTGRIVPAEAFSETDLATFSVADQTERFDLPRYFLIAGKKLAGPVETKTITGAGSPETIPTRQQRIESALEAIRQRKAHWNGDYREWDAAAEPIRSTLNRRVFKEGGELRIGDQYSFFRALQWPPEPFPDDVASVLISLKDQLAAKGIDLIVIPFPSKNFANVDLFKKNLEIPPGGLFPFRDLLFETLLEADVYIVDLLPELIAARDEFPYVHYDGKDHHPADGGVQVIAREIGKRLQVYDFPPRYNEYSNVVLRYSIPEENERFSPFAYSGDPYVAHRVLPLIADRNSIEEDRVLLLGDSIITVPYRYGVADAMVADHIGAHTGYLPKLFRMSGSSPQVLRRLATNPEVLDGVEVVVFCFAELYLYYDRSFGERYTWEEAILP